MNPAILYEPDKYWSACQAGLILFALVVPLIWTVSFRQQFAPTPLVVTISAPPVVQETPVVETPDLEQIQERIEAARAEQEQAEIARRRAREAEQQRELEERRRLEEEAERKRLEEEERRLELEKRLEEEKAEEERKRQEVQRRREEEQRRLEDERRRQAEEQAEAQRQAEAEARLKADRDARIMSRYIAAIHERVERHLANPEGVPSDVQVEIRVLLDAAGKLAALPEVVSSSGHVQYDEEAVHAVILGAANGFELPSDDDLRKQFSELLLTIKPRSD